MPKEKMFFSYTEENPITAQLMAAGPQDAIVHIPTSA